MHRAVPFIISGWRHARLGLVLLALAAVLAACSAVGLAYRQSTTAIYWWLDAQLDLNDAQSTQVRRELDALYVWHRQTELPDYLSTLRRWQSMASQDLTANQICKEFEQVREAMETFGTQASPALARLALTLEPDQIAHLAKHQARDNEEHLEEVVQASREDRMERRLEKLTERYERLYGPLNAAQLEAIKSSVESSSYDPERSFEQRKLRQEQFRAVLRRAVAQEEANAPAREASVTAEIQQWFDHLSRSPTPGYQEYAANLTREGCAQFARVHQSATAEQRAHAMQLLQSYEVALGAYVVQD